MCAKTWSEIADEYSEAAEHLSDEIRINRDKLSKLSRREVGKEAYKLKSLLNVLYEERRNVRYAETVIRNNYCDD